MCLDTLSSVSTSFTRATQSSCRFFLSIRRGHYFRRNRCSVELLRYCSSRVSRRRLTFVFSLCIITKENECDRWSIDRDIANTGSLVTVDSLDLLITEGAAIRSEFITPSLETINNYCQQVYQSTVPDRPRYSYPSAKRSVREGTCIFLSFLSLKRKHEKSELTLL